MNTNAKFLPGQYYHVFKRTNNGESLFKEPRNRQFFLDRFNDYLRPFCYVHSYVLMRNHFHYSLQIKSLNNIVIYLNKLEFTRRSKKMIKLLDCLDQDGHIVDEAVNSLIVGQFQSFFNSYAKSINKSYNRVGSLFQRRFKRSVYDPVEKFRYLQYYIHHNARKHRVVKVFTDHIYSSYQEIVENDERYVDVEKTLHHFDSLEDFIQFHNSVQFQ